MRPAAPNAARELRTADQMDAELARLDVRANLP